MRNFLLLAGPVTDPRRFMAELDRHPDVAALPPVSLGNALHAVARRTVDAADVGGERGGHGGGAAEPDSAAAGLVARAREQGGAALAAYFASLRASIAASAVVLHDPGGPMFPLLNPPGLHLLVLSRDADSVAATVGAGGISRVVDAATEALSAFERRVASFGLGGERIHRIDEAWLRRDPAAAWPAILTRLDVDADEPAVSAVTRQSSSPTSWSLGSGLA